MEILISFAAKVAEYAVKPIARQVGYLMFHNAKFEELADHVKELEGARDGVMHRVEEERRSGKIIEPSVQNWLDTVRPAIGEANQLQEDRSHAKVRCFKWSFPNLVLRHPLGRKAAKMSENIVQILKNKEFGQVAYLPALDGAASTYVTEGNENFESRKPEKEDIMKALRDPKTRKIGVFGLGGVGKTTLVTEVAQLAWQEKLFDAVVIANVSKTPDLKTIQGEIADQLGLRFEEETVAGRALRLKQRIMREKTILIILDDIWKRLDLEKVGVPLDDIWNRLDLEKVGVPFRDGHIGCKLLMTSRSQDVLREMLVEEYIRLEVLNEEETWRLFKAMAGDVETEPLIHQLAHQVAKRCAGLPILIVTVARSLINQDIHMWKQALRRLESADNKQMEEITYSALEFTYNMLPSDEMKAFFLLCAYKKWPLVSDLFKYGMGLGIFNNTNTMEVARDMFSTMIRALKASCLLLEGDTSTWITMHDVVREVAISIASRDQHTFNKYESVLKEWPTKDFLRSCSQIIIHHHIRKLPEVLDCPNLKLLYLGSDDRFLEVPDSCFEEMKSLQVLDLTGFKLANLPISFRSLSGLKTLCLDQCILENMDGIEALENLEILSLLQSSMMKLPSEIGKLTQLRMLDLSNSGIEIMPPKIISSLIRLEELYLGNTSIKWEEVEEPGKPKENASLTELRELSNLTALELQIHEAWVLPRDLMFDKLEKYKIVIGDVWEWPESDIAGETLKALKLKLSTSIHLEHGLKTLIKRAENLYLDEVEGIENVLYQLHGEGFPELKHLHIQNHAMIKHIIDSVDRNHAHFSFPKLETLVVQNLNCLEKICQGPLIVNSFARLRIIKVENCIQLKYLLSFSMVKGLHQLSEIEVCRCNSMDKVVFEDGDANADNEIEFSSLRSLTLQQLQSLHSFFSYELTSPEPMHQRSIETRIPFFKAQLAFLNLETLKLSSLNFNNIWEDNQRCFHKLTNLIVESCSGLKYLFSYSMVKSFPNLMKLEISDCYMMEEIIATKERSNNIVASEEVRFSKLGTIILKDMENLKTIWHSQFDTLKILQVENCEKIMVVFPSSMQKTYNNLETLIVANCPLVEEIFELTSNEKCAIEDTTYLKSITLRRLPELKHTWSRDPEGILSFDNLENVCLESCENLQYLFPLSVATGCSSHLQRLDIRLCGNMKEIITQKEGTLSTTAIVKFNQLNTLRLWSVHNLKGFYASHHTFECTSLRTIDISDCAKLSLFKTVSTSSHNLLTDGKSDVSVQQSPFIVEQVIPNLENLRINQKHGTSILQAQAQTSVPLFTKLSFLGLSEYKNEDSAFPDWFLQNVNTLELLVIANSFFKKIFLDKRRVNEKICTRLKKLALYQLPKLLHICEEGFQIDPVLEVLKYLDVYGCPSLLNLVPSSVTFSHLVYLEIQDCNRMVNLISSSTARSLAKLTKMEVNGCYSLEEIIMAEDEDETMHDIAFLSLEILMLECLPRLSRFCSSKCFLKFPLLKEVVVRQCPRVKNFSEGDISTPKLRKVRTGENKKEGYWKGDLNSTIKNMFEDKVAFPNLEALKLSPLNLNNTWKDNQHCFHKLKNLIVESCGELKYLFSYNMVRSIPNLMKLEISDCYMMEEIIAAKDRNNNIVASEEVRFSKLDTIILKDMENLKIIWHNQFDTLKMLQVENCQQLMVVFPSSMQKTYNNLETLIVADCPLVEEIFELTSNKKCTIEGTTHLKSITLRRLPELKHTWSRDPEGILHFPNLEDVNLESCENLQYLFPLSVATSCSSHLQRLQIKWCGNMKEIIAQKEGSLSTTAIFKFNQLDTLVLRFLYELKGFYASSHTFECPSLRAINVAGCAKLSLFKTLSTSSHKLLREGKSDVSVQQSPFIVEQVIPNLEWLRINQKEGTIILQAQAQRSVPLFTKLSVLGLHEYDNEDSAFPDWFLQNVNTLEWLMIEHSSFKKIFLDERCVNEKICMQLKKLTLNQLPELLHICEEGFQIDPVLEVLEYLDIGGCPSLLSLVPSSVTFSHLVYLEVQNCNGMVNLVSSSTARSLAKLTEMKVKGCDSLVEIIMIEDGDESIHDITFLSLEILMLECLPRLARFCSSKCFLRFPLLKEIVVRQCPHMKNFSEGDISTPKLRKVRTGENKKEGHWKGDLNSTIKNMFEDKVLDNFET